LPSLRTGAKQYLGHYVPRICCRVSVYEQAFVLSNVKLLHNRARHRHRCSVCLAAMHGNTLDHMGVQHQLDPSTSKNTVACCRAEFESSLNLTNALRKVVDVFLPCSVRMTAQLQVAVAYKFWCTDVSADLKKSCTAPPGSISFEFLFVNRCI
jgi:hypothetical protein